MLILTHHSSQNADLSVLTAPNKWRYAARHGYDLLTLRMEWAEAKLGVLLRLREILPLYDWVMMVGSDVVFTNFERSIEWVMDCEVSTKTDMLLCREPLASGFPINNDVTIWRGGEFKNVVLDSIIYASEYWLTLPWLWQEWLAMGLTGQKWHAPEIPKSAMVFGAHESARVRLLPTRAMNSCHQDGPGKWQEGDFIFHAVDYGHEQKKALCSVYLGKVKQ